VANYNLSVHSLVSIDDKGRVLLPIKLREALTGINLILTRGVEDCLWLFPNDAWEEFSASVQGALSIFDVNSRLIQRRILAPANEAPLDGTGRLKLSPSLMAMARLKKECYLIGMGDRIEIWDSEVYDTYDSATAGRLEEAFVSLAPQNSVKD
jgi:MraZ protein